MMMSIVCLSSKRSRTNQTSRIRLVIIKSQIEHIHTVATCCSEKKLKDYEMTHCIEGFWTVNTLKVLMKTIMLLGLLFCQ